MKRFRPKHLVIGVLLVVGGYDLRATPARCPECGAMSDTPAPPRSAAVGTTALPPELPADLSP